MSNNIKIVIDPGHSGQDNGVIGFLNGTLITEKSIALSIGLKIHDFFSVYYGLTDSVILTRKDDTFINAFNRAKIINQPGNMACVTIHVNSSPNTNDNGFTSYVYYQHTAEAEKLITMVHNEISPINRAHGIMNDKGIHGNKEKLLELANIPTVQVMLGYLSNPFEITKLTNDAYQRDIAHGIAMGIAKYLQLKPIKQIPGIQTMKPPAPVKPIESTKQAAAPYSQTKSGLSVSAEVHSVSNGDALVNDSTLNTITPTSDSSPDCLEQGQSIPEETGWLKRLFRKK